MEFQWDRSDTILLAAQSCAHCQGLGLMLGKGNRFSPCNCVLRGVFRACYRRFRICAEKEKHLSRVSFQFTGGKERRQSYGRLDEEYMADFCLIAKRVLNEEEHRVFRFHFLLGAGWRLCCRQMKMDRGSFFHVLYRLQHKLGKAFREMQPYGLFPVDDYFKRHEPAEPGRRETTLAVEEQAPKIIPIRPPIRPPMRPRMQHRRSGT